MIDDGTVKAARFLESEVKFDFVFYLASPPSVDLTQAFSQPAPFGSEGKQTTWVVQIRPTIYHVPNFPSFPSPFSGREDCGLGHQDGRWNAKRQSRRGPWALSAGQTWPRSVAGLTVCTGLRERGISIAPWCVARQRYFERRALQRRFPRTPREKTCPAKTSFGCPFSGTYHMQPAIRFSLQGWIHSGRIPLRR